MLDFDSPAEKELALHVAEGFRFQFDEGDEYNFRCDTATVCIDPWKVFLLRAERHTKQAMKICMIAVDHLTYQASLLHMPLSKCAFRFSIHSEVLD